MRIDIITLFPKMFSGPFSESIVKRAQEKGLVDIKIHDLRSWAEDKHKTVDDRPYGGGTGMILKIDPIYNALQDLNSQFTIHNSKTVLLDPGGTPFTQDRAQKLSKLNHIILITGHYEGVDHRVREHLIDEELSIGDYVLTGGELPAMVIVDAIVRLIPHVLEKPFATLSESFSKMENDKWKMKNILEYPQYTRPEEFKGWKVPQVLLSGNHKEIEKWKKTQAVQRTKKTRPDLI